MLVNIFNNIGINDEDVYLQTLKLRIKNGDLKISKSFEKLYLLWLETL